VNDVGWLHEGDGQFSVLCEVRGGVIDALMVYRLGADRFLWVVNASNTGGDLAWLREHATAGVELIDRSAETGLLALQGPAAARVLAGVARDDAVAGMKSFTVRDAVVAGEPVRVARTGYTGEDGFEVFVASERAGTVWDALMAGMARVEGLPCGLAARDTLRLEAALPLHGADMDRSTTPLEAGLAWVVKLGKGEFVGRAALQAQHQAGVPRRLVGLRMDEERIPRHGQGVWHGGREVGQVTSGTKSPTLGTFIGMAYVTREHVDPGTPLEVDIRGRRHAAHVVERPFYRRAR
jgi:aminomethyltransferase